MMLFAPISRCRPPLKAYHCQRIILHALAFLIIHICIFKSYAYAQSLDEIIHIALERNYDIRIAEQDVSLAEYDIKISRGDFLPNVSFSTDIGWSDSTTENNGSADQRELSRNDDYRLSLDQNLFNLEDIYGYKISQQDADIQTLNFVQTQQDVMTQVTTSYLDYLKLLLQMKATQLEKKSSEQLLKQVNRNVELGNVSKTDLYEAQTRYQDVLISLIEVEKNKEDILNRLNDLTQKRVIPTHHINADYAMVPFEEERIIELQEHVQQTNIGVLISKKEYEKSDVSIKQNYAKFSPTVSARAAYGYNYTTGASSNAGTLNGRSRNTSYTLNLNIPLFSAGQNYYGLRKAREENSQSEDQLYQVRSQVKRDLQGFVLELNKNAYALQSIQPKIAANQASYEGLKRSYKMGVRTVSDLLESESELFDSVRQYYDARYDYLSSLINIYNVMGDLEMPKIMLLAENMSAFNAHDDLHIPDFKNENK